MIGVSFGEILGGEPNTIEGNLGYGVHVDGSSVSNNIRKNSINKNQDSGIYVDPLIPNSAAPDILPYDPPTDDAIEGFTAAPIGSKVDIYETGSEPDARDDQAETYVGTALVTVNAADPMSSYNTFRYETSPLAGNITATVTSAALETTTSSLAKPHSRRVMFPNGTPLGTPISGPDVRVFSYQVVGYQVIRLTELDGEEGLLVAANGTYPRPFAFLLREAQVAPYDAMKLGVLVEITYTDPGVEAASPGKGEAKIVNYPSFDPLKPLAVEMTGYEDIVVPYPTVLHTGLLSGIPGFEAFRKYLHCDAGSSDPMTASDCTVADAGLNAKRDYKIPAFVTFSMPSRGGIIEPCPNSWSWCRDFFNWAGDDVPWGYNSSAPMTPLQHDENAIALHLFINNQMGAVMQALVPDQQQRAQLPINMCGHSMGAQITRAWRYLSRAFGPPVAQYVTFDGVHGGTTLAHFSGGLVTGFAEWMVNGFHPLNDSEPIIKGWNYHRSIGTSRRNLLMSSSCPTCVIVNPNHAAFGVGRTMRGGPGPFSLHRRANGHRGRFIGGWELHSDRWHVAITSDAAAVLAAAKFMAYGVPPSIAVFSRPPEEYGDVASGRDATEVVAEVTHSLASEPGTPAEVELIFETAPSAQLSVMLAGEGAFFDLLDGNAQSVLPAPMDVTGIAEKGGSRLAPPLPYLLT